jgi:hypothetical protein
LQRTISLQRICALQWVRALQRIARLRWAAGLTRTGLLLLVLILLVLTLRVCRASKPDQRSGHKSLRLKCNFIHEGHLVPSGNPGNSHPSCCASH